MRAPLTDGTNPPHGFRRRVIGHENAGPQYGWNGNLIPEHRIAQLAAAETRQGVCDVCGGSRTLAVHIPRSPMRAYLEREIAREKARGWV